MKTETQSKIITRSGIALALALAIWSPAPLQAAEPTMGKTMAGDKMMDCCKSMKDQQQKMMAEMKADDVELTAQIAKMNSAPKDKKVDLLATVVTRMAEQRVAANARMEKMHEAMAEHMMKHIQMDKGCMSEHPMMKGMDQKSGATSAEQK